jgi:hypothetical protein
MSEICQAFYQSDPDIAGIGVRPLPKLWQFADKQIRISLFVQAGVVHVMWWLGLETDDAELGSAALFCTLTMLLGLHVALITEIIRKEFSFYHTCVALQFIALYMVLLNGHVPVERHTVARIGFGLLVGLFFGELCYATSATASALEVAKTCSTAAADLRLNGFILVYHNWVVLSCLLVILSLKYAKEWASERINSKLVRFGIFQTQCFLCSLSIFVAFQVQIVGQFQKYMDPSENGWSFGQIVALVVLVGLLFEFYRQALADIEIGTGKRWRTWVVRGTSPKYGLLLI